MRSPKISNQTEYDGRTISGIIRYAFRYFDIDPGVSEITVKYSNGRRGTTGTFYHRSKRIVVRLGAPDTYPRKWYSYARKNAPPTFYTGCWKEALVAVVGHEMKHLDQSLRGQKFVEADADWAAIRLLREWQREKA